MLLETTAVNKLLLFLSFLLSVSRESFSDIDFLCVMLPLDCLQQTEEIHPRIHSLLNSSQDKTRNTISSANFLNVPNKTSDQSFVHQINFSGFLFCFSDVTSRSSNPQSGLGGQPFPCHDGILCSCLHQQVRQGFISDHATMTQLLQDHREGCTIHNYVTHTEC